MRENKPSFFHKEKLKKTYIKGKLNPSTMSASIQVILEDDFIEPGAPVAVAKKIPKPGVAPSVTPMKLPKPGIAPVAPKKLPKPGVAARHSYSPHEVKEMDDNKLCAEFVRLTGHTHLSCTHCRTRPIELYWVNSIRKRAMKMGLSAEMKIPKTCDAQQFTNELCNPINNPAYQKIYQGVSHETKKSIVQSRQEQLNGISIAARPYRHIV